MVQSTANIAVAYCNLDVFLLQIPALLKLSSRVGSFMIISRTPVRSLSVEEAQTWIASRKR